MTADLLSHSRRGRTYAHCPLIKLEPCALAVITWGVPLHVRVQCDAGMDVLERRCRSVVVVPTPLALGVALYTTADVAAQVRRCAQLQTRAHGALASHLSLHCISWQRRCSSRVLARVHGLHMRRHPRTGSGSRLHDDPARGRALALATSEQLLDVGPSPCHPRHSRHLH